MNVLFLSRIENILATPPLDGMILPGITRQSVLDLTREWDEFQVEERNFTMDELIELNNKNKVSLCYLLNFIQYQFMFHNYFIQTGFYF